MLAIDQWTREIPVIAERGLICDRDGTPLAENITSYSVFLRPNAVKDKQKTSNILSQIFNLDNSETYNKISSAKSSEITIVKKVDKSSIEKLTEYDLSGVYYSRDNTRSYVYNELLCQVLGFTSTDNEGLSGIEKYYDNYLKGTNGEILYDTDLIGIEIENGGVAYKSANDGLNVKLTIDYEIQVIAENAMQKVYQQTNAKNAQCIVLDPNTFEILAMAKYPSYNLNEVPRDDTSSLNELSRCGTVCDIYEPGSTFKIITASANIEERLKGNTSAFSNDYIFSSARTRNVDGTTVKCWSDHNNGKHSNQTLADALNNSCNPCFTDMALALGTDTFYNYLNLFNFGNTTGIDFAGEALGMLIPESAVKNCDLARIGFGQTIAVTPLQLACAAASCVNGGKYFEPHLVKEIYSANGKTPQKIKPVLKNRTISEEASRTISKMLEGVVSEGSGKRAYIEGYGVGGKTGTAQKYENGKLAQGKYVSSFLGFFPYDNPQYLTLITVDEPQGAYYGSVISAPCANEIFQGIIDLKNIKPYKI